MQGASAIQEILRQFPNPRLRVFVVWEPVLATDWAPPTSGTLSRISDPRASQFWDRGRLLSGKIGHDRFKSDEVVWDFVALFVPGAQWAGSFPEPKFADAPVVNATAGLRRALVAVLPR